MLIDTLDNILDSIKAFSKLMPVETSIKGKNYNFNVLDKIIMKVKEDHPLINVIPYGGSSSDTNIQIVYGPFYVCNIIPIVSGIKIKETLNRNNVSEFDMTNEVISHFSVGLRRRSDVCKAGYIELPSEFRDEIIKKMIELKEQYSGAFSYIFEEKDRFSFDIINKIKDFEEIGISVEECCSAIIELIIKTSLECVDKNSDTNNILQATRLLLNK